MIEARTKGTNDWLIGSQLVSVIRSMANPPAYSQPATMSQYVFTSADHGGVHINSGIINRAYYLLAAGFMGVAAIKFKNGDMEAMGKNLGGAVCLFLVPEIIEVIMAWAAQ